MIQKKWAPISSEFWVASLCCINHFPQIFKKHSDCYFQLFTNGTLLTPEVAETLRQCANVTPLISFEGDEQVADVRRGGKDVFQSA